MKQITIGRNPDNDIVINDASVSRHHATIVKIDDGIIVCDNGSSNGTFINGNRILEETFLQKNDILKMGTVLIPWKKYFDQDKKQEETKTKIVSEVSHSENTTQDSTRASTTKNQPAKDFKPPRKSKKGLFIGVIAAIIVVVFVAINLNKNSSYEEYYSDSAQPVVLNVSTDFVEKGILDKTLMGYVEVENQSNNAGYIEIIATCEQEGKSYQRTREIYLESGQSSIERFEFREIKRLKYEPTFSAVANAIVKE